MKKISKFLFAICGCFLVLAMVVSNVASTVKAASADFSLDLGSVESSITIDEGKITVPSVAGYDVKVTNPRNEEVVVSNGEAVANLLGHYTVTYTKGAFSYSYSVFCKNATEYFIDVDATIIPSFVKKDTAVELPTATVYYIEDEEKVYLDGVTVSPEVVGEFTSLANVKVVYSYAIASGVYAYAEYEVKVQDNFTDSKNPSMSVKGWKDTATLNAALTLPTATVSDNYDERVSVSITVTDPEGNPALAYEADDNGYAIVDANATYDEATFVNGDKMTFYPVIKGDYKVVYTATDDSDNDYTVEKTVTVSDLKGPVIEVDTSSIPENWGYEKVYYLDENDDKVELANTNIILPIPTWYDNNQKDPFDKISDTKDNFSVTLRIKNPAGDEAARVNNIQKGANCSANKDWIGYTEGGYVFEIKEYVDDVKAKIEEGTLASDYAYEGYYTVQYTVVENETGSTTTTALYQIDVVEEFEDKNDVEISSGSTVENDVILEVGDKFTLPSFNMSSESDSKLTKEYDLKLGSTLMGYNKFEGSEEVELISENGKYYLAYEGAKLEVVAGENEIVYTLKATADSGKYATNEDYKTNVVVVVAEEKNYVVTEGYDADGLLNNVSIALDGVANKYVGVELGLRNADNEYLLFTATIYYDGNGNKVIKDIEFPEVNATGTYYFEVRVFDIYGNSVINVYPVELTKVDVSTPGESIPSKFSSSVSLGESTTWFKESFTVYGEMANADVLTTAHKISGGRFSAMGKNFTPLANTTYTVTDFVLPLDNAGNDLSNLYSAYISAYSETNTVKVSASSEKVIALDSAMPTLLAKNAKGNQIPQAVIYDANKNYSYTISVTDPSSKVKSFETYAEFADYTFSMDGNYSIAYKVSDSTIKTYTVKVGDITAPTFTIEGGETTDTVVTAGTTINFAKIVVSNEASLSKITFKKAVYNASGELVGSEINGKGSNYANNVGKGITLSTAGEYTVVYTVIDEAGNDSVQKVVYTVQAESTNTPTDYRVLATILTIVAVLAIAGVVVYLFTGRRGKKASK